jgi:preprotein translocase subunit SecB
VRIIIGSRFGLVYAGVFRIMNVLTENLHPPIMIEYPRLLFPFAREIIATSVRGRFQPVMLDTVDFVGLTGIPGTSGTLAVPRLPR